MYPPPPYSQFPTYTPYRLPASIPYPTVPKTKCSAKLINKDLWGQFYALGTEMVITKTGRRMFPSLRTAIGDLDKDAMYFVVLEMVPRGDCRYKYSGSHWIPAGGAEPQSSQRIYIHPDSPASGLHWMSQPVLFNKVKLTNNTLDNNGHIVLTSMHKYTPRLHIVKTSDPLELYYAPQQSFTFAETEFIAVTAYQNERITKLKIDNNPFAKGFRETGRSRTKKKTVNEISEMSPASQDDSSDTELNVDLDDYDTQITKFRNETFDSNDSPDPKRKRLNSESSISDECAVSSTQSSGTITPSSIDDVRNHDENLLRLQNEENLFQHLKMNGTYLDYYHTQYPSMYNPMDLLPFGLMAYRHMYSELPKLTLPALPERCNERTKLNDCNNTVKKLFTISAILGSDA